MKIITKLKDLSELVVLPHSVFALPFALVAFWTASGGHPEWKLLGWVVLAMVLARTFAMAYNRLVDADLDARNPRTQNRPIPTGRITVAQTRWIAVFCAILFLLICRQINDLAFWLSPVALAVLLFYSHTKFFTWTSHLVLGFSLGIAPVGAWIAVTGRLDMDPLWLLAAVTCFVAGFDIPYAALDEAFDRKEGLHSWVTRWGLRRSLTAARWLHILMLGFLVGFGANVGFKPPYYIGVILLGFLLLYQHRRLYFLEIQRKGQALRLSPSFFTANGWMAVLYFLLVGANYWF